MHVPAAVQQDEGIYLSTWAIQLKFEQTGDFRIVCFSIMLTYTKRLEGCLLGLSKSKKKLKVGFEVCVYSQKKFMK